MRGILIPTIALGLALEACGGYIAMPATPASSVGKPVSTAPTAASSAPRIVASLSRKQLYLREGNRVVATYAISDGKDGYRTPRGVYRIRQLNWNPGWTPPKSRWARNKSPTPPGHPQNPMKVVKIFFKEPTYYIHGTGETERLGNAASHGCLRMAPEDVAKVGRWVMEHGGTPREESWFRRLRQSPTQERVVYLSDPIPIEITD